MDTKRRTLGKTISWYIVHNGMMFTITFVLTGSWELGVTIAVLQTIGRGCPLLLSRANLGSHKAEENGNSRRAKGLTRP
jgi:hypothetical protein